MVAPAVGVAAGEALAGLTAPPIAVAPAAVAAKNLTDAVGSQDTANRVNAALRGRIAVDSLTPDERAAAARYYRDIATRVVGSKANDAKEFNLLRASFLEGDTAEVPGTLPEFICRKGGQ